MPSPASGTNPLAPPALPLTPLAAPVIDAAAPLPPEESFDALYTAALAQVQALSGATWTDYNEHDPGVTMLEALCYALTDIGYRTHHPIADIIASSAATHGLTPAQMALYTPAEIFPTAPVTAADVRALLRAEVSGLSEVTLAPRAQNPQIVDVYLHPARHPAPLLAGAGAGPGSGQGSGQGSGLGPGSGAGPGSGPGSGPEAAAQESAVRQARAERLLQANRPMGLVWGRVREMPTQTYVLEARIEIAPETDPAEAAALILKAAAEVSAPVAVAADPGRLVTGGGLAPASIFEGPEPHLAAVPPAPPATGSAGPEAGRLRQAIARLGGPLGPVRGISRLSTRASAAAPLLLGAARVPGAAAEATTAPGVALRLPALDSAALSRLELTRMGAVVALDPDAVRARYAALDSADAAAEAYDAALLRTAGQPPLPLGNPHRQLARYHSVQFLFPQIYGLGRLGMTNPLRPGNRAARQAEILQLKGYLLFFEQIMADTLAQLDALAPLLSSAALGQSYFPGPLLRRPRAATAAATPAAGRPTGPPPPEVAPHTALLLGAEAGGGGVAGYLDRLQAATATVDAPGPRLNRALSHMLARFGEALPDSRRLALDPDYSRKPAAAWERLLADKRRLLAEAVPLGRRRGLGPNHSLPEQPFAFLDALRLRTGFRGGACLVEHAALAPVDSQHIQALELHGGRGLRLTGLLAAPQERYDLPQLLGPLRDGALLAECWQIWPQPDYSAVLALCVPHAPVLTIYQRFRSVQEAGLARALLLEAPCTITPGLFPSGFFGATLTCLLSREGLSAEAQAFVGRELAASCPAHLHSTVAWVDRFDLSFAEREYAAQLFRPAVPRASLVALLQREWVGAALARVQLPARDAEAAA